MSWQFVNYSRSNIELLYVERETPQTTYSSIAQLAEHSTVNRRVSGSSPVGGAKLPLSLAKRDYLRFVYISSGIQSLSAAVEVLLIHRRIKPEDS